MKQYVLDVCALIALLKDENGSVTDDHHEMDVIESENKIGFYWIR